MVAVAVQTVVEDKTAAQAAVLVTDTLMVTQLEMEQVIEVEITNHIIQVVAVVLTEEDQINIVTTLLVMEAEVNKTILQVNLNGMLVAAEVQDTITLQKLLEALVAAAAEAAAGVKTVPVAAVAELKDQLAKFTTVAVAETVL